jgi:hypothetical protein
MKYIRMRLKLIRNTPKRTIHFGPNLSVIQPVIGASKPPWKLTMLAATDVNVLVEPNYDAIGLNSADIP